METKVAATTPAPDPRDPRVSPSPSAAPRGAAPAARLKDPADERLVIEIDQASGSYVYKVVDRATGDVVRQLPRAEVLRLRHESPYAAGAVIRAKA
jgi:flagellar protein FlaG